MSETITTTKATVDYCESKIQLFNSLMKSSSGQYIAVLSDDSIDRDGEIVGKSALNKLATDNNYTAILLDHENKIENLIGEWTNKRIETIDGHSALVAEPKFYKSNPKAEMIKGILDEGGKCGISIGAIVKGRDKTNVEGKSVNVYTELELVEASFVAIPSNRHGMAMALAKKFEEKLYEETQMEETEKTFSEAEYSEIVEAKKSVEAQLEEVQKANKKLTAKVADLEKSEEVEEAVAEEVAEEPATEEVVEEPEAKEASAEVKALQEKNETLAKEIEALKAAPINKATFDTPQEGVKELKSDSGIPVFYK